MNFAWIDTQCRHYPLSALCEVLGVSVNGYRAWKRGGTPERQRLTDAQLPAHDGGPRDRRIDDGMVPPPTCARCTASLGPWQPRRIQPVVATLDC